MILRMMKVDVVINAVFLKYKIFSFEIPSFSIIKFFNLEACLCLKYIHLYILK